MSCANGYHVISPTAPAVDLGVLSKASQTPAIQGDPLTFTVDVNNVGSLHASNVQLSNPLPANTRFVSVSTSQGSCSGSTTVTCNLGSLASGAKVTIKIVAQARTQGNSVNTAKVTTTTTDKITSNNSFGVSATVK